jgi:prepilin-type N-terminal cleavage/methylation domain-containing protein
MKQPFRNRRCSSFTLVELLVVIGIIAILASVLLFAGNQAIKAALRAKAATMMNQIQVACMAYYNDYSVYPIGTNAVSPWQYGTNDEADWAPLMWGLCGNMNAYTPTTAPSPMSVSNTRGIAYLQLNRSNIDANGIPLNPIAPTTPSYFNIDLDGAYTGILTNVPIFSSGTITTGNLSAGIYVWANCNSSSGVTNNNWYVHSP